VKAPLKPRTGGARPSREDVLHVAANAAPRLPEAMGAPAKRKGAAGLAAAILRDAATRTRRLPQGREG
jgi:hypothetical protein